MTKHFCPVPMRREKLVKELLEFLGFSVELPVRKLLISRHVSSLRRKTVQARSQEFPLLSGYVLVNFDGGKPLLWHQLLEKGVIRRGKTLAVTDADIERMIARNELLNKIAEPRQWKPGDTAKIADGPMAGKGIIVREVRGSRVTAICEAKNVSVKISQLEAA